jgi:sugar phosphate isomerase/epimerase
MSNRPGLGIQLYTVRDDVQKDFSGTIRRLAAMGYEGIEGGVYKGDEHKIVREIMDETGLKFAGSMTMMTNFETELEAIAESVKGLDCDTVLCPWIMQEDREDLEGWKKTAARKQKIGEACRAAGLKYLYHIHGYEFSDLGGGTTGMDVLVNETDDAVGFEIDIYWAFHGGADPVSLYQRLLPRTPFLHLKDMIKNPNPFDVEVGDGIVPVKEVVDLAMASGCEWMLVEQEQFTRPPMEAAEISLQNVRRMMG